MFEGMPTKEKDPRKSLHVEEVATPDLGPGEAIVAVMASSVNYNTVWTSIFEPVSTFGFLRRYGRISPLTKRHDLPYHVVGSDLAGVVVRTGPGVARWKAGDRVVAHCLSVELESPDGHDDTMMDPQQRIWGFETNFGGLAELAVVKANQLMPKPKHLTWEEAASPGLVNSTAYRQLISKNGAAAKLGDVVLIWGASGGLGSYATQMALGAGAYVARKGGTIVTCASTSGFLHQYDNRYLWMNLKRIIGSHFANYREAWEANRLVAKGRIHPTLSKTYPL